MNCWNPLKLERYSAAGNGVRECLKSIEMNNGKSAAKQPGNGLKVQRLEHGVSKETVKLHECVASAMNGRRYSLSCRETGRSSINRSSITSLLGHARSVDRSTGDRHRSFNAFVRKRERKALRLLRRQSEMAGKFTG